MLDARVGKFQSGDGPEICVAELVLSERVFSIHFTRNWLIEAPKSIVTSNKMIEVLYNIASLISAALSSRLCSEACFHDGEDAQEGFLMCSPDLSTEPWLWLKRDSNFEPGGIYGWRQFLNDFEYEMVVHTSYWFCKMSHAAVEAGSVWCPLLTLLHTLDHTLCPPLKGVARPYFIR